LGIRLELVDMVHQWTSLAFVVSHDGTDEDGVSEPGDKRGSALESGEKAAFIAGLWFIGTFVFSIPAALLYDPVLSHANYILGQGADT
jgi:hypothetical protein